MEKYRVIFQVNEEDPFRVNLVLNNIQNLIADLGEENVEIELVAYSMGVKMFFNSSPYADMIYSLLKKEVRFAACSNTLNSLNVSPEELIKGITVVPSGIGEIVRKQKEEWIYIRP
ncbi:MAG: DsrE family protein [Methanobacteriaceae archaeon]|nr:DsrE family protein [Methanobacteriaceae archaeon]MDP2835504.1 DsrE family protein [Methanobacteriaceae archaeon]MDP3035600.1 DsrE family protein [Methanobacteriaceae archaeon]MDP3484477.1 DsrE family protein [Methanobacteriaceae archaeon]